MAAGRADLDDNIILADPCGDGRAIGKKLAIEKPVIRLGMLAEGQNLG
jgi:hypothetical protein